MKKRRHIALWFMAAACFEFVMAFLPVLLPKLFTINHIEIYVITCMVFFFVLAGVSIVISLLYWRCPGCQKGYPIRYGMMDKAVSCPFCGEKIK